MYRNPENELNDFLSNDCAFCRASHNWQALSPLPYSMPSHDRHPSRRIYKYAPCWHCCPTHTKGSYPPRLLGSVIVPTRNASLGVYFPVGLHLLGTVIAGRVAKSIGDGADKLIGIVAVCTLRTTGITDGVVALLWKIGDPTLLVAVGSACMDAASLFVVFPTERVPVTVFSTIR